MASAVSALNEVDGTRYPCRDRKNDHNRDARNCDKLLSAALQQLRSSRLLGGCYCHEQV